MREWIVPRSFDANVETDFQRYGARTCETLLEPREQLTQGALAAEQQAMDVPRLGRPSSIRRLGGQSVAL